MLEKNNLYNRRLIWGEGDCLNWGDMRFWDSSILGIDGGGRKSPQWT